MKIAHGSMQPVGTISLGILPYWNVSQSHHQFNHIQCAIQFVIASRYTIVISVAETVPISHQLQSVPWIDPCWQSLR